MSDNTYDRLLEGESQLWKVTTRGEQTSLLHDITDMTGDEILQRLIILNDSGWVSKTNHKFESNGCTIFTVKVAFTAGSFEAELGNVCGKRARKWSKDFRKSLHYFAVGFREFLENEVSLSASNEADVQLAIALLFEIVKAKSSGYGLHRGDIARAIDAALASKNETNVDALARIFGKNEQEKLQAFIQIMANTSNQAYTRQVYERLNASSKDKLKQTNKEATYDKFSASKTDSKVMNDFAQMVRDQLAANASSRDVIQEPITSQASTFPDIQAQLVLSMNNPVKSGQANVVSATSSRNITPTSPKKAPKRPAMTKDIPSPSKQPKTLVDSIQNLSENELQSLLLSPEMIKELTKMVSNQTTPTKLQKEKQPSSTESNSAQAELQMMKKRIAASSGQKVKTEKLKPFVPGSTSDADLRRTSSKQREFQRKFFPQSVTSKAQTSSKSTGDIKQQRDKPSSSQQQEPWPTVSQISPDNPFAALTLDEYSVALLQMTKNAFSSENS